MPDRLVRGVPTEDARLPDTQRAAEAEVTYADVLRTLGKYEQANPGPLRDLPRAVAVDDTEAP